MTAPAHWLPITTVCADAVTGAMVASFADARDLLLATRDTEPYLLLVCADSTKCSVAEISLLVNAAIDTRCAYFCAWGPDCGRLDDIYDETCVIREIEKLNPPPFTMTTWHADQPLHEAVFFALEVVQPDHCDTEWNLESLPRRLLVIGSVATWNELLAAVDYEQPD